MIYRARDLHFQYWLDRHPVPALRGVSLEIHEGESLVLSGPSGSGKSTLLALLGLIEPVQAGSIRFLGEEVAAVSEDRRNQLRRHEIGFIFQSFQLFPTLSAEENVEYFLIRQGVPTLERKKRVKQALEAVGLWNRRQHRPLELSGGQRQRVAIARAAAKRPKVILADEPTASLDQQTGKEILAMLDVLRSELKTTLVIASHDPMVLERAGRVYRLADGVEVGS
jgi:putative ABC transport system ATP-binding protein